MGKLSFIGAAERGRLDVVTQMMSEGIDINITNSRGHNALRGAVRERHPHVVQYLLDHGADIDAESATGWTALYIAAHSGDQKMVRLLLSRGASVEKGASPLVAAVASGSLEILQALTDAGADIDAHDDTDCTPLRRAVELDNEHFVDVLLRAGANVHSRFTKGWFFPTEYYRPTEYSEYYMVDETILHVAARRGNARIIKLLLDHGCVPDIRNHEGNTPLELAFRTGNPHVVGEFRNSPGITADQWQPLFDKVVKDQDVPALEKLLLVVDKQVIAGTLGRHLLAAALCKKRRSRAMLDLLLRHGADINAPDADGRTLLHEAADVGPKRISRLLKRGANINVRDRHDRTPLHDAACCSELAVQCLLAAGADPNVADEEGMTPLHFAAAGVADQLNGMTVTISIQLDDTDSRESVIEGDIDSDSSAKITEMLINNGADVNAHAHDGSTPLSLAEDQRIISLLKDAD